MGVGSESERPAAEIVFLGEISRISLQFVPIIRNIEKGEIVRNLSENK